MSSTPSPAISLPSSPSSSTLAIGLLATGFAVFASFDIWWFLRLAATHVKKLLTKRIDIKRGEESVIYSFCSPTDIDYFCHMNNGRYLREMDFGRFDLYFRSALGDYFWPRLSSEPVVAHASVLRWRRSLDFLTPFRLHTKLVYFDERSLYFEQRFISIHDNFVRAVAVIQNTAKNTDVVAMMREHAGMEKPKQPPEIVKLLLQISDVSSQQLRAEAGLGPRDAEGGDDKAIEDRDEKSDDKSGGETEPLKDGDDDEKEDRPKDQYKVTGDVHARKKKNQKRPSE